VRATAFFRDGPCKYTKRTISFDQQPPEFLTCKGTRYIIQPLADVPFIDYVVQGGTLDLGSTAIQGHRDVFNAWAQIHTALNKTVPHKVNRIRTAGRRIRRAVR